jgi:hypothetical protein
VSKAVKLLAACAVAFAVGHLVSPFPSGAQEPPSGGCNKICHGPFPGECTYYYANYFCVNAVPPWTVCQFEQYTCT